MQASADLEEAQCRNALYRLPCEQRMAASERYPNWSAMSWQDKLRAAKGLTVSPTGASKLASSSTGSAPSARRSRKGSIAGSRYQTNEWLKMIFETSDSLKMAMGHHREELIWNVVGGMKLRDLRQNEMLVSQGQVCQSMFVVREGLFDVVLRRSDGREVRQYGPGSVIGEPSLWTDEPRAASIVARSASRVWRLDRPAWEAALKAPEEAKSIGLVGGVMLLINNLAGPTIVSMPALAQQAGWLSLIGVQVVVAAFSSACGYMLIEAMRCMPGNHGFEQTIEFTNLASFYLPYEMYVATMVCYHVNSILNLMSLIIQSGQVMDYIMLNVYGCAPGIQLGLGVKYVCGTRKDSATPFGDSLVLSSSMLAVALICAPFAVRNLDDNVILQYLAVIGLSVMSVIWISLLVAEPTFPSPLPVATTAQSSLVGHSAMCGMQGTVLFNFAFTSTLPSWVNEKKAEVSVGATFWTVMGYVVVTYTVIGIVGGLGGSRLGQATVAAYPMLQNVTSIPVLAILIRSNLIQGGLDSVTSTFVAVGLPWLMSIPLYTGSGFDTISEIGGLATSSIINFMVPLIMYVVAVGRRKEREELLSSALGAK
eukprot:s188_g7.t1